MSTTLVNLVCERIAAAADPDLWLGALLYALPRARSAREAVAAADEACALAGCGVRKFGVVDASGHLHAGKGSPDGGQFVSKGGDGGGGGADGKGGGGGAGGGGGGRRTGARPREKRDKAIGGGKGAGAKRGVAAGHHDKLLSGGGWVPVQSEAVTHAHYDPKAGTLSVRWKGKDKWTAGVVYEYAGVSAVEAKQFAEAPSAGKWVNDNLKRNDAHQFKRTSAHVLELAPPKVHEVLRQAKKLAAQGKGAALAHTLAGLLVPEGQWTAGYAQQAVAACLDAVGYGAKDRVKWTNDNSTVLEIITALSMDQGWVHHGGTGAADLSSGPTTYKTADGKSVVLGVDTKKGKVQQDLGATEQKARFIDYDPAGEPDGYVEQGVKKNARRMEFMIADFDVARAGKKWGFAYIRAMLGGGGWTTLKAPKEGIDFKAPSEGFEAGGKTYKKGETVRIEPKTEVPPEVLSASTAQQRQAWGFKPFEHAMPVKIKGLQSPEDLMRDPVLMRRFHDQIAAYAGSINYDEYAKAAGGKLAEQVQAQSLKNAKAAALARKLTGQQAANREQQLEEQYAAGVGKLDKAKGKAKELDGALKASVDVLVGLKSADGLAPLAESHPAIRRYLKRLADGGDRTAARVMKRLGG